MMRDVVAKLPVLHRWVILAVFSLVFIIMLLPSEKANASRSTASPTQLVVGQHYDVPVVEQLQEQSQQPDSPKPVTKSIDLKLIEKRVVVQKGDNLAKIFKRNKLSAALLHRLVNLNKDSSALTRIMPGNELTFLFNEKHEFQGIRVPKNKLDTLIISKAGDTFETRIESKTIEKETQFAGSTIQSSFWSAGSKAGLTDAQIMTVANIFGWDIDFALDLRKGDSFNILYEKHFVDGEYVGRGDILAAEFINQGEVFQAIRHSDGEFYTPEGRSMRKAFLRAPVSFKYISSNFKPRRYHPILKRWKSHNGVDYRARSGTPVLASGNGKVIRSGYTKYNGYHVFIQHGNNIQTKYLHFKKRPNVKKGQRVKQGQVIGYVGMTGLAEAPHLHYEFLVNGVHRNPRTVKLPKSQPIAKKERAAFELIVKKQIALLDSNKRVMLAMQP
ncbi:OapA family protein [Algicola sagamiensis]|uniref:OapA family protein n=1 Tax=Algicola sagamiensis TaxID=163869 RepID=UPI0003A65FF3|nr:peptidoglycan DD-metalloendopeptidase family protein [Algicola sagamiensis]